jgi:hypothetical protein
VDFDDIIIGSGLSALGAALGLDPRQRILVLAGPSPGVFAHYDARRIVPCAYLGTGGLGNYWHGVIPMSQTANFGRATESDFANLFARFYPGTPLAQVLRQPQLFVPWQPIRPANELTRLAHVNGGALTLRTQTMDRFSFGDSRVLVRTLDGSQYRSRRLWIAAGSLHTPALLERSLGGRFARGYVSDHALCYVGLLGGQPAPAITRTRDGTFFPAHYESSAKTLYTLRPARFAFRKLDVGIEQRAVFGLPTGSAVVKIMRRMSPALVAEALYNRAGVFPKAGAYSVYAQTIVADAYVLRSGALPLEARLERILDATAEARERVPFAGLRRSQRCELYIPGIHLHHSLDLAALTPHGINRPSSPVQIVDASVVTDIGPDHPSFKFMLLAYARARRAVAAERGVSGATAASR